jgi:hypothetical protein
MGRDAALDPVVTHAHAGGALGARVAGARVADLAVTARVRAVVAVAIDAIAEIGAWGDLARALAPVGDAATHVDAGLHASAAEADAACGGRARVALAALAERTAAALVDGAVAVFVLAAVAGLYRRRDLARARAPAGELAVDEIAQLTPLATRPDTRELRGSEVAGLRLAGDAAAALVRLTVAVVVDAVAADLAVGTAGRAIIGQVRVDAGRHHPRVDARRDQPSIAAHASAPSHVGASGLTRGEGEQREKGERRVATRGGTRASMTSEHASMDTLRLQCEWHTETNQHRRTRVSGGGIAAQPNGGADTRP